MKYAVGLDYGTLSARALVVEVDTGRELRSAVFEYPHGVMDERLPDGTRLPPDWALEHPRDYLDALRTIPEALRLSGVSAEDVIGLGIDFTACTMLPVDEGGEALCLKPQYAGTPHAYVKLWKHHAAQEHANRLNRIAEQRGEPFLARYGGKISSEWMFPKIWQILDEAPDIYDAAARFLEAGDWVIATLTGTEVRSACMAGYKAMWHKQSGYPSPDFFAALDPRLRDVVAEKLPTKVVPLGTKAGELTERGAALTGLPVGTAVAVCNVDAHVAVPAAAIDAPRQMLMIMGTSTCHMLIGESEHIVPGMCGVVEDGVLPGFMGYEAGQSCVGDHFGWFVDNLMPGSYEREAQIRGISAHELLTEKAAAQKPGAHGLVALDWWNGNRSVLVDADLTGVLVGMTLLTKPEDIYRALIEATAYGTRVILETFEQNGVPIEGITACGGIAKKNAMLMQIYADVTNRTIRIAKSTQAPALGSAMFGAVAAGAARGGYDDIFAAARAMGAVDDTVYAPIEANRRMYDRLYAEYKRLHDELGRGGNDVLKRLKEIRREAMGEA